jgi:protein O-mannosyl-transferase
MKHNIAIALLAIALYANTLGHHFVMDDTVVLTGHKAVQQGLAGIPKIFGEDSFASFLNQIGVNEQIITGGRYRPFSLAFFAVGVSIWGNNAFMFHLCNVLLFAGCAVAFYQLLRLLLPGRDWAQLAAAVLFVVHPIHTEVVANIKSADELWSFLFGALAAIAALQNGQWTLKSGIFTALFLFLALLSKEIAIVWAVLVPLMRWMKYSENLPTLGRNMALPMVAVLLYGGIRMAVIQEVGQGTMMHEPLNNPFLHVSGHWVNINEKTTDRIDHILRFKGQSRPYTGSEKTATVAYTLLDYARLMVVPHPLSHDYSPFYIRPKKWSDPAVLFGAALSLGLLLGGAWFVWRRKSWFGLGALWFLLPLLPVCNLFFTVGTFLAERFLMLPSAGFCLMLGLLMGWLFAKNKKIALGAGVTLAAGLAVLTVMRNPVWHTNEDLLRTDMDHAPNSARIYMSYGDLKVRQALQLKDTAAQAQALRQVLPIFEKGLALHPIYFMGWHGLGIAHFNLKDFDKAIRDYQVALTLHPNDRLTQQNLGASIRNQGEVFKRQGNIPKAILYLEKAYSISPDTTILPLLRACQEAAKSK